MTVDVVEPNRARATEEQVDEAVEEVVVQRRELVDDREEDSAHDCKAREQEHPREDDDGVALASLLTLHGSSMASAQATPC
jgi:hypothetical protein